VVDDANEADNTIQTDPFSTHKPLSNADEEEWGGISDTEVVESAVLEKLVPKKQKKQNTQKKAKLEPRDLPADNGFQALADEDVQDLTDVSAWEELQLLPETLMSLSALGFGQPTPIQSATIPLVADQKDVIGKAPTGSGKTLAFGIPILEHILRKRHNISNDDKESEADKIPTALIVAPTRELAHQISDHLKRLFTANTSIESPRVATLTGGLSQQKQQRLLTKADVVIGTPGRLWEVIRQSHGYLALIQQVSFLVLDEADRLLSDGHFEELEEIINLLTTEGSAIDGEEDKSEGKVERQTLVFSATFSKTLQQKLSRKVKWSGTVMNKEQSMEYLLEKLEFTGTPEFVDINPRHQLAEKLDEGILECAALEKDLFLYSVILQNIQKKVMVFTNSISAVRRVTPFLQNLEINALPLHSQMIQKARMRSIERFTAASGKGCILVATDVAARGLDIKGVQMVIHYHLPRTADMYIHRSGRTARAENTGLSIVLCSPEESGSFRQLLTKVHTQQSDSSKHHGKRLNVRSIDIDRRITSKLKPRVTLAKKLADSVMAKEQKSSQDNWLKNAAEELGVEYDSDEFEANGGSQKGRGSGRAKRQKEAQGITKQEMGALKAELKSLLSKRVNVGVSERYLASGRIDVGRLLRGEAGEFLGEAPTTATVF
jgi:ATP-dependent RNA helicase DDX24/MAK5